MKLNPLFQSGAVFAANKPIRVFGEAVGVVRVSLAGNICEVNADGRFIAELPALDYTGSGESYTMTVECGCEKVILRNIVIGDVFLLAGQSNMELKIKDTDRAGTIADEFIADSGIRFFFTRRPAEGEPYFPEDGWVTPTKEDVIRMPAIGYHLAAILRGKRDRAIGLVTCYQGASVIQSWLPESFFTENPSFVLPDDKRHGDVFHPRFKEWNPNSFLYHYTLEKIIPFSVSTVLWYQGESNSSVGESMLYDQFLAALIGIWRRDFADASLPFVIIQLADYAGRDTEAWHRVQDMQAKAAGSVPYCSLVATRDINAADNIHPVAKFPVAKRIADLLE